MPLPGIYASQISGHLTPPYDSSSYYSLATVTVPSGGAATITFAGIPTGYKHLQYRVVSRSTNASYYAQIQFTVNGASSYYKHLILADGVNTPPGAYGYTNEAKLTVGYLAGGNCTTGVFGAAILDVFDYCDINKYKTIRGLGGANNNSVGTYAYMSMTSGAYPSFSAITTMTFNSESGNFAENTKIALYGVK